MIGAIALATLLGAADVPRPVALREAGHGCGTATLSADAEAEAEALTRRLRDAEEKSATAPAEAIPLLRESLAEASTQAILVAQHDGARQAQRYARLALVRSLLATGDRDGATAEMDALLATAGAEPLPARLFGPSVVELHGARAQALADRERGELVVECSAACLAIADDTLLGCANAQGPLRVQLPAGTWRVTVAEVSDASHRKIETIDLGVGGPATVRLEAVRKDVDPPADDVPRRRLPRWAGILGMAVGAGAMITGGVLVGVDGRCPDLKTDPNGPNPCDRRLNTDVPGIVMLVGGGALFTGFTIPFAIGEARLAKQRRARARIR